MSELVGSPTKDLAWVKLYTCWVMTKPRFIGVGKFVDNFYMKGDWSEKKFKNRGPPGWTSLVLFPYIGLIFILYPFPLFVSSFMSIYI